MRERSQRWKNFCIAFGFFSVWLGALPVAVAQYVDSIAAIVNEQVITFSRLDDEVQIAQTQLAQQNIPIPDHDALRKDVLQRLIMRTLEAQQADRLNIRVSDAQVQQTVMEIAQRNQISVAQLREELARAGMSWEDYLQNVHQDLRTQQLRQQAVENSIHISQADVDAYLRSQALRGTTASPVPATQLLGLAQMVVAVPESASAEQVQALRAQVQTALERLRAGEDFAADAASVAYAVPGLREEDLGVRPEEDWPELFTQAVQGLAVGQFSDIVQSGAGLHILRVTRREALENEPPAQDVSPLPEQMLVTQTHARHILIKTSAVVTHEQARTRLEQLVQRIEQGGEAFEDLARRYSQDTSAPQGGDLGWLSPGETVPAFEQAMDSLSDGQISAPVQSPFGWHLIQVLARRTQDMKEEYQRVQARQALFQRRAEPAYEEWLNRLREQAYIENRLEASVARAR